MSLRTRLLGGLALIILVSLAVVGTVTYVSVRSFLLERLDDRLADARVPASIRLASEVNPPPGDQVPLPGAGGRPGVGGPGPGGGSRPVFYVPPGTYAEVRDRQGNYVRSIRFGFVDSEATRPDLPAALTDLPPLGSGPGNVITFTADAADGRDGQFRVQVSRLPNTAEVLVVALPTGDTQDTLSRLLLIEIAVSLGAVLVMMVSGFLLLRGGLRPLEGMASTADAIAAGNLARRVTPAGRRSEVGRLGLALNGMLNEIEAAFAQRKATEERLRRFVADASHELRTPLTSIRGYAELFQRGAQQRPEDLALVMLRIEEESRRMGVLVEDLLQLARLDQGRPLEMAPVALSQLVREEVDTARTIDPGRELACDVVGGVVVEGDAERLRQVVRNLLANVRSHTPPGTAASVTLSRDDGQATLRVRDRGPGIPLEHRERIFERFYRADVSRSRASGGTGLGLSIAAAIVGAHGGSIRVAESDGPGATLEVRLPALVPAAVVAG